MRPTNLPGGDLIATGLNDLRRGLESIPALLVSIGAPRLQRLGYAIPAPLDDPEQRLYALLARDGSDEAHPVITRWFAGWSASSGRPRA